LITLANSRYAKRSNCEEPKMEIPRSYNPTDANPRAGKPAAELSPDDMKGMATALVSAGMPEAARYLMVAANRIETLHKALATERENLGKLQAALRGSGQ
jgi:hypothetical protein